MSETRNIHITDHTRQLPAIIVTFLCTAVCLILAVHPVHVAAENDDFSQFNLGKMYYETGDYDAAINSFSRAVSLAPENSGYHHWLGKSYGMLARESGLLTAYALSRKTRLELERAVELDDQNIDALTDLMEFYRQAPAFLGGGAEKADKIRIRLEELNVTSDSWQDPDAKRSQL